MIPFRIRFPLVVLKPFPLEYDGYTAFASSKDPREQALAADPELDQKIETALALVEKFYERMGFRQLPPVDGKESNFWAYCPEFKRQPRPRKRKPFRLNRHACKNCKANQAFHDAELCTKCEQEAFLERTRPAFEKM